MSNIFKLSSSNRAARKHQVLYFETIKPNQANFFQKVLRALVLKIWSNLPEHLNFAENLSNFKNAIKSWNGDFCQRNLCKTFEMWGPYFLGLCLLHARNHSFIICKLESINTNLNTLTGLRCIAFFCSLILRSVAFSMN